MAVDYLWMPTLSDVGAYVPTRTVPVDIPGNDNPTGTFTASTVPADTQVTDLLEDSSSYVASRTGTVDPTLYALAKAVAAMRTAAFVELSYPTSEGDNVGQQLLDQSEQALAALIDANASIGGVVPGAGNTLVPVWSFPAPVPGYDTTIL